MFADDLKYLFIVHQRLLSMASRYKQNVNMTFLF